MKLKFKQAVCLNGIGFSKGINEVGDSEMAHPFFKKMFDCGLIVEPTKSELTAQAPEVSNNAKLAAHLEKIHAPIAAGQQSDDKGEGSGKIEGEKTEGEGSEKTEEPSDLEPEDHSHDQEPSSEESHSKSKHKHGKKK